MKYIPETLVSNGTFELLCLDLELDSWIGD